MGYSLSLVIFLSDSCSFTSFLILIWSISDANAWLGLNLSQLKFIEIGLTRDTKMSYYSSSDIDEQDEEKEEERIQKELEN